MKVGVISDTHGLLRPEALAALQGVDYILHAGDIGRPDILTELQAIAPMRAIRGNIDRQAWAQTLPETDVLELAGHFVYMLHDLQAIDLDPVAAGFHVVISGHSHRPLIETKEGVCYLNPGSAGPFRFRLPVTLAYLWLKPDGIDTQLVSLVDRIH